MKYQAIEYLRNLLEYNDSRDAYLKFQMEAVVAVVLGSRGKAS